MELSRYIRKLILPVFLLSLIFALAFILLPGDATQVNAQSLPSNLAEADTPDNDTCLACHQQPMQTITLPSGDVLSVTLDPVIYTESVHSENACTDCHTGITGYPHPENNAQDERQYVMNYYDTCMECHADQYDKVADSMHQEILDSGNLNAPACSDCHNPHTQRPIYGPDESLSLLDRIWIPETCAKCHSGIYETYAESVHGSDLTQGKSFDVPTCIDCHGVHNIPDPGTAKFHLSSIEMCADCHTNPDIMDKYNISTNVLTTYVADFHGETTVLFEKTHPDEMTNKPVCYDCHGVHNIQRPDDPEQGISIKENLLVTCQRCHPDAEANFPDSWMSHYIPDQEKYPLVYYVQLFYQFMIPSVLGGMALFVVSDFARRQINRFKKSPATGSEDAGKPAQDNTGNEEQES